MRSRNKRTRTSRTSRRYNRNRKISRKRTNRKISRKRTNRKRTNRKRTNRKRTKRKINRLIGGKNEIIDSRYPDLYYFQDENKAISDDYNKVNIYFKGGNNHGLNNYMLQHYRNSRSESQKFDGLPKLVENTGTIIADDSETNSITIKYAHGVYQHTKYEMDVKLSEITRPVKKGRKFPPKGFYIELTEKSRDMRNEVETRAAAEKERKEKEKERKEKEEAEKKRKAEAEREAEGEG